MTKQIKAWKTSDGSLFEFEDEADEYELMTSDEMLKYIYRNKEELIKMVRSD